MEKYILDTNLFFNMEAGLDIGQKTEEVIKTMTHFVKMLKASKSATFFMPPRVVEEFLSFFEDKEQPFLKDFLAEITVQSPSMHELNVPASIVYQLVEDIRARSYRGLNVGEEEIQNAGKAMTGKSALSTKDFQIAIGQSIKHFRDRYRQATRFGFLDSLADLDLIMLAKEIHGVLVSTDEGVMKWGRIWGVKEMPVQAFGAKVRQVLGTHHQE